MIRKFFGHGDLFIYAASDTRLQGIDYAKGDIISSFEAITLSLEYNIKHKEGKSENRQLSHIDREPYSLNVGRVPNTKEVERLFFKSSKIETVEYSTIETYKFAKQKIMLKESPLKVKTFSNGIEIKEGEGMSYANDTITFDEPQGTVKVVSYFREEGERRTFDKPQLGYVTIKAVVKGKGANGEDGTFVLDIPLADLVSEPEMDLSEDSNYNVNLSFALINSTNNAPTVVLING